MQLILVVHPAFCFFVFNLLRQVNLILLSKQEIAREFSTTFLQVITQQPSFYRCGIGVELSETLIHLINDKRLLLSLIHFNI